MKIIGSVLDFGLIAYVTKQDKFNKQMTYKMFKDIMVGYTYNYTRD